MQAQSVCDRGSVVRRGGAVRQWQQDSLGSMVHAAIVWADRADEKAASVKKTTFVCDKEK